MKRDYGMNRKAYNRLFSFVMVSIGSLLVIQLLTPIQTDHGFLVSRFIVVCIFIWCVYRGLHEDYYINPYILFSLTPLSLMIYSDQISNYFLRPLNQRTWIIAIINMVAFLIAMTLANRKLVLEKNIYKLSFMSVKLSDQSLKIHAIVLFIIGKIPDLILMATGIAIPFGHFFSMCQFLGIAVAYKSGFKRLAYVFCGLYFIVSLLTTFNKTNFLMLTMVLLICLEGEAETKKQRRKVVLFTVLGALFLVVIAFPLKEFLSRGGSINDFFESDLNALPAYYAGRITWNGPMQLMMPYMYFTTPWNNLQYIMETTREHTYGLWLLKPLLGYIQVAGMIDAYTDLTPYQNAFNTYGFISVQYIDFGMIGSTISSIVLGTFVGKVYRRYRHCTDGFNIGCYGLVACATLEMFFSNHFFGQSYPFTILIVAWSYGEIGLRMVFGKQLSTNKNM